MRRVFLVSLMLLIAFVGLLECITARRESTTLDRMARILPGMKIDVVKGRFNSPVEVLDKPDEMLHLGPIQDAAFCEGKKLYIFDGAGLPSKMIDVYTDGNDAVVFVTWHQN